MMLGFDMNCIAPKPITQRPKMMGFASLYPSYPYFAPPALR